MALVIQWPATHVWGLLTRLAAVGRLAIEAWLSGDRDLLVDCERWHIQIRAALARYRRVALSKTQEGT